MGESTVFTDTEQDGGERNGQWLHPLDPQMSRNYRDLSPVQFYIRTLFRLCGWQCISSRLCFDQIDIAKGYKEKNAVEHHLLFSEWQHIPSTPRKGDPPHKNHMQFKTPIFIPIHTLPFWRNPMMSQFSIGPNCGRAPFSLCIHSRSLSMLSKVGYSVIAARSVTAIRMAGTAAAAKPAAPAAKPTASAKPATPPPRPGPPKLTESPMDYPKEIEHNGQTGLLSESAIMHSASHSFQIRSPSRA